MSQDIREVVIIGSGPAGLTAAIYNARARLNPLVVAGVEYGGQLMGTTDVENFPGFPEGIMGPQLMMNMLNQAKNHGAEILYKYVTKVDFSGDVKKLTVDGQEVQARSVILAVGSSPRLLDIPGEKEYWGKGVSSCATCDGAFYRDKIVAVIGGGDSAMEEANFLTKFASKVYLIHRRDEFRASKAMQEKVFANEKIEVLWNTKVDEVKGDDKLVNSLEITDTVKGESKNLEVNGMFLAIGHIPNSDFLDDQVSRDDRGFVDVVSGHTNTNIPGVFVAGDVHDHHYQQAITAAGMGCMAALDVEKYLQSLD